MSCGGALGGRALRVLSYCYGAGDAEAAARVAHVCQQGRAVANGDKGAAAAPAGCYAVVVHAARVQGEVVGVAVASKGLEGLEVRGGPKEGDTACGVGGLVKGRAHD